MKKVNFTKMQSLGNDFIIIDNLVSPYNNFSKKEIKKICDRNYGVGCDQLLILKKIITRRLYAETPTVVCDSGYKLNIPTLLVSLFWSYKRYESKHNK